jgi:hypothetical protein
MKSCLLVYKAKQSGKIQAMLGRTCGLYVEGNNPTASKHQTRLCSQLSLNGTQGVTSQETNSITSLRSSVVNLVQNAYLEGIPETWILYVFSTDGCNAISRQ